MDHAGRLETGGKHAATAAPMGVTAAAPVPLLQVSSERLMRIAYEGFASTDEQVELPVLALSFRYGEVVIPSVEPNDGFATLDEIPHSIQRDLVYERAARRLLESFGAIELSCLEHLEPSYGSSADYVIRIDGDVHAYCSFGAYALPQLRALGWQVQVDEQYPYRVVSGDTPWYADIGSGDERPDWFSLELGVTLDGQRVNMLPALLELLDRSSDGASLASLSRIASRCVALPVGDQLYVPIPAARLMRMLTVVRQLHDPSNRGASERLEFGRYDATAILGLDEVGECGIDWQGGGEVRALGRALSKGPPAGIARASTGLKATLRPYQTEGVAWLQHLRSLGLGGVLADDMGLGKTLQMIAHLLAERESGRACAPSLVVAPTSVVANWSRELKRFAPSLEVLELWGRRRHPRFDELDGCDVAITSYPLLWRDLDHFEDRRFHVLALDEAQMIKNGRSRAHRAARSLDAEQRVCMTGTPMENNLGELHAIFDFLMPGLLGSSEQFRSSFRIPIELGNEDRLEQLRQRVSPFVLRRLKCDVAKELPPKTEVVRPIDLHDEQRELYEGIRVAAHADVRKTIRKKGLAASTVPVLDALMKLRQVCCDPRLVKVPAARKVKRSAKLEVFMGLMRQLLSEGRRVLVFSQFTSMLSIISEALLAEGIGHLSLTGSTNNRQARVDAFQEGRADVFLISLKAGGTGLTLTRADTVIHYDPWWNPAAQNQATDRAYRIGQKRPVFVYKLIVAGSVEERMLGLQQRKQNLADAILSGHAGSTRLRPEDVEDLFAPLAEA
jgi:superfamily II DNA or RNA helicase